MNQPDIPADTGAELDARITMVAILLYGGSAFISGLGIGALIALVAGGWNP